LIKKSLFLLILYQTERLHIKHVSLKESFSCYFSNLSPIHQSISTQHPYQTRNATSGLIRFGGAFAGDSTLVSSTFKHRAVHCFNAIPVSVRTGTLSSVKKKLRKWTWQNIPIDWG
jgi:hypothetical protein